MSTGGHGCHNDGGGADGDNGGRTFFDKNSPIDSNGTINRFCVYINNFNGSPTGKIKIFRQNGSNIDFIGESASQTITGNGVNTFDISSISVNAGDYVGYYTSNTTGLRGYNADPEVPLSTFYIAGDKTTNSAQADWGEAAHITLAFYISLASALLNVYVDINKADDTGAGTSFSVAKKTMKAGWDILESAGTMHVASGDYSAQTTIAYNKSWKLSCEDPNSVGYKNVKIPPSA